MAARPVDSAPIPATAATAGVRPAGGELTFERLEDRLLLAGWGLDPDFGTGGITLTDFGSQDDIANAVTVVQADGSIISGGQTGADFALTRHLSDGTLDTTFGVGGKVQTDVAGAGRTDYIIGITLQSDGKIVVAGGSADGDDNWTVARYNANGTIDTGFGTNGFIVDSFGPGSSVARDVVVQADGKLVVVGDRYIDGSQRHGYLVARYHVDGTTDTSFGSSGSVVTNFSPHDDSANAVALQGDGKIVVAGRAIRTDVLDADFSVVRYNTNGSLDGTFGSGGIVTTHFGHFENNGGDVGDDLAILPDGRILLAGNAFSGTSSDMALAMYTSSGALDSAFGTGGLVLVDYAGGEDNALGVVVHADGTISVGGRAWSGTSRDIAFARFSSTGVLDTSFGDDGFILTDFDNRDDSSYGIALTPEGQIVSAGYARPDADAEFVLLRYIESSAPFSALDLSTLNGTNGFRLDGIDAHDESGSVSSAGDVNGDGYEDIIIGAHRADPGGDNEAGESYVVFGQATGFAASIDLSSLNGTNGFRLDGIDADDRSGWSVSGAGDVNGDGFDDLIVGAFSGDPPGGAYYGETYVVFGKATGFTASLDLGSLNGTNGFRLDGIDSMDYSGRSVSGAGDVNGDGFDDLIIGAFRADPGGVYNAGESYVVFGKMSGFAAVIDLATLDGTNGFRLDGIDAPDKSGISVSGAGDVNGDGFDDLIVGAHDGDPGGDSDAGETYIVFGRATGFAAAISLASLNGSNGFRIDGIDVGDNSGWTVSGAGDVNGDGFDDVIIGTSSGDPGGDTDAGESYVVFGKAGGFASALDLSTLDGTTGFRLDGIDPGDRSGYSVSGAGDVNGDGFDDLIVGAWAADVGGANSVGETYVVYGRASGFTASLDLSTLNGTNGFRIDGIISQDFSGLFVSGAGDVNGDGFDDLIIGAIGADADGDTNAGESYVVFGGNFTGGAETQVGGTGGQTLTANQGAGNRDVLIGGRGDDTLVSDGGADVLIGGQGQDTLRLIDVDFSGPRRLDGGTGSDTLQLSGSGLHLNLTSIRDNRIQEIEIIDLTGSGDNTLTLNQLEVLNLSPHSNTLLVRRNAGDVVNIGSGWSQQADETISSVRYKVFTQGAATVKVENVAPTATANVNSTTEAAAVSGNVLTDGVADSDPDDAANTLVVSAVNGVGAGVGSQITLGSGALLTVNANGTYTYNPNGQFESLNVGQQATDSFQYTVRDPGGLESTATVTVTITGLNDAPVATANAKATSEDAAASGNVLTDGVADSDVDNAANTLVVSAVNGVAASVGSQITLGSGALLTVNANGTYAYNPNGQFESLNVGQQATDSFQYTVRDPDGLESTATVTVTINGTNDSPLATPNSAVTTEASAVSGNVLTDGTDDSDVDNNANTLVVSGVNGVATNVGTQIMLASGARLTVNSQGDYVYDPSAAFEAINFGQSVTDAFTYSVRDPAGLTSTAVVTITVHGANDGITYVGNTAFIAGTALGDVFTVDLATRTVTRNAVAHVLPAGISHVSIDGQAGTDTLRLVGTAGAETVRLFAGQGLLDSSSVGLTGDATGMEVINYFGQGGADLATLTGSTGTDKFVGRGTHSFLQGPSAAFKNTVVGVATVVAESPVGGIDTAFLFDTSADNTFTASPTTAAISGTGVTANAFETVVGYASGGTDSASLTGTAARDVLLARQVITTLTGSGITLGAVNWEQFTADGAAGSDLARLFGRAGVDTLIAGPTMATLSGTGYQFGDSSFETVIATGELAVLQDSTGNDQFSGRGSIGTLATPTNSFTAEGFSQITIRGTNGGTNRRTLRTPPPLGFSLISQGTWV